jgi:hypothetical protein
MVFMLAFQDFMHGNAPQEPQNLYANRIQILNSIVKDRRFSMLFTTSWLKFQILEKTRSSPCFTLATFMFYALFPC